MALKTKIAPAGLQGITIVQSNKVTKAVYDYSLHQERIFTWIMYHLQVYIKEVMNGKQVHQLDLFSQKVNTYLIDIPLYHITTPDHYNDIREVCEGMATIPVVMLDNERNTRRVTGLIASVETKFAGKQRVNTLRIEMREDVIKMLIHVDKNNTNKPSQYTQYLLHVAIKARNKYTPKLYRLLCSWREKGGFRMKLEALREFLQIPEKSYRNFSDLKRYVLLPAQKELKDIADLWFNCADADFVMYEGKKVSGINFKIIEPMTNEILATKINHVFWAIKNTFSGSQAHCEQIRHLLSNDTNWERVRDCLDRCYLYVQENHVHQYARAKYVVNALTKDLTPA